MNTVTAIKQNKGNLDRVSIFLDQEFWVSLNKDQLLEYKLHKDKTLSQTEKKQIEKASQLQKLKEKTLQYLQIRPRSVKEIRDYLLYKRKSDTEEAEAIIAQLTKQGFLSDREFAKWWIESRLEFSNKGKRYIERELIQKGVSRDLVSEAFSEFSAGELLNKQLEKIKKEITKVTDDAQNLDQKQKQKLIARLAARGFGYGDIKRALSE